MALGADDRGALRRPNMGRLDGKVTIVTGASRGIGKSIAKLFAAEGANVVCAARTLTEGGQFFEGCLETTVAEIEQAGGRALPIQCDISTEENCDLLIDATKREFGRIDVLVNNAVHAPHVLVKDFPVDQWMAGFAVGIQAPFILSRKVLPEMIERGSGAIVNITSGASIGPGRGPYGVDPNSVEGNTMYGTVKAALERFTQGLASEVYENGITVAALSPSRVVPTPGTIYMGLVSGPEDPKGEPPGMTSKAVLLLATGPLDKVTGWVTSTEQVLAEFD